MAEISVEDSFYTGSLPADSTDPDWVKAMADLGAERLDRYETYERWYDGEAKVADLDDRAKKALEGEGVPFNENYCEIVVDTLANRLRVDAVQVTDNDPATEWLKERLWTPNGLNVTQGIVHVETPKLGDGILVAGWDAERGRPRLTWNHPKLHRPVYSEDGDELLYDVKRWATTTVGPNNPKGDAIWRMNIYFPDRVEKWFSADKDGEEWEPWKDRRVDADGNPTTDENVPFEWPMPWVDAAGDPLGLPVFHFRNRPQGRSMGRSDVRGAIPFNRQLNKQVVDLFYVMDEQGWKQRWGTGIPDASKLELGPGLLLRAADKDAKFGEFSAEDPTRLVATIEATLTRLSARTGTPLHDLIKGTPPSGEALKTANAGRDGRAHSFADVNGPVWADASRMGWHLSSEFGEDDVPQYDPDADLTVVWSPPEDRSEKEEVEIAEGLGRIGVSKRTLLRRAGFDPEEEAKWRDEESRAAAEAASRFIGPGGGPGEDEEDE